MRSGKQSQGPDLLRADMEYTASGQTDDTTGFRKVKGDQKCVRRDLLLSQTGPTLRVLIHFMHGLGG